LTEEKSDEWEESVKKDGWTPLQHRVFNKVVKLLVANSLSWLATENMENEAVHKKIYIEGFAKKLRIILSSVAWDVKITQWLHLTLIEHLNQEYLMCYIGILQVLRNRVPTLVDRMLNTPLTHSKLSALNTQIMNFVINKPWEPVLKNSILPVTKLSTTPMIILVPSGSSNFNTSSRSLSGSRRFQTWHNLLSSIGRVLTVSLHSVSAPHTIPLPMFVEAIINATIQRVQEMKSNCPGRPIILAGLQQGALIAAQVAYMEPVSALLCLGFPLFCVDGKRGEPDDFILDIRSPTMIAIGQSSSNSTIDGVEELRHRMKAETTLLVVEGATDSLRMFKWKKKQQNVTQSMVDACILEEISTFITAVLSQSERKTEAAASASSGKRSRHSNEFDDLAHTALTGHDYSQGTGSSFAQPVKGRGGQGLTRVRGGRVGPSHSRTPYQRNLSDGSTPTASAKGRIARLGSGITQRTVLTPDSSTPRPVVHRSSARSSPNLLEVETDSKSTVSSCQGSPKEDLGPQPPLLDCKVSQITANFLSRRSIDGRSSQGGDSSETESAPPADDDEDVLEDLRFASEFLSKHQPTKRPLLVNQNPESSDNSLMNSADEAEVCRRLCAENLNRQKGEKNVAPPE